MSHATHQKITAASLLVALGIIYGDIGTSPLYVMKAIIGEKPIEEVLVYGGLSCVFWTLVFQTTFKYVMLTLMADNKGEGGVFSLYALVRRYGKGSLVIPTILGATTLLADGMITPPISVASAVEGLEALVPHLPTVPIVVAILTALFFFQRFGTQKLGTYLGPVMAVWFVMLFVLGFVQLMHYPDILKALSPHYAFQLLSQYPQGFWILGAVFLCTTGAEALYSDLGHCGRKNIRISWIFVKTCLIVNYLGQSAWLLHQDNPVLGARNPFYEIMPDWFLIIGIIIAAMAAIIASQALISGSYTLISEAIALNFWPRVAVRNPTEFKGQIYIPSINAMMWVGCVTMILYFQNSTNMEGAYGFCITVAMIMTSVLLAYFLRYVKKWNAVLVGAVLLLFLSIESSFFIANLHKVVDGGWVVLPFLSVLILVMLVWFYARKLNNKFISFKDLSDSLGLLKVLSEDDLIPKFSTHLIYLTKANNPHQIEEKILKSIFSKKPKRADVYWFVHINRTDEPYTLNYRVEELLDDKVIRVDINIGFRVQARTELYFKRIVKKLVKNEELNLHIRPDGSSRYNPEPDFKFVVIEKYLSVENSLAFSEGILLSAYFFLKNLGLSDAKAFGLDKSDVVVEQMPLVYQSVGELKLERLNPKKKE